MKLDDYQLGFKRLKVAISKPPKRSAAEGNPLLLAEVVAERRVVDSRSHLSFHFKQGGLLRLLLMNLTHCKLS